MKSSFNNDVHDGWIPVEPIEDGILLSEDRKYVSFGFNVVGKAKAGTEVYLSEHF